ncbi:hypothetical protein GCM10027036_38760 [Flavihumibacter cheonanensis]|uniref:glycosyltransferase n=1 Tax=Flavihumibacter cheonanensis TaxID=1442385 RepID=UPI001EF842BB|nr:glycosyltransferase [Flavihumibacter cheonanensis]MCG7753879.1 glycosyltransferase [Flavihumibacter cheonanensis]
MKILINTASTLKGGGVQVALSFLNECKNIGGNNYHVILGITIQKLIDKSSFPSNFYFYPISFRPATKVFSLSSHNQFFKNLEDEVKPDVVFTTSGPSYWRPKAPHLVGFNLAHHIYPDSPYFKKINLYRKLRWRVKKMLAVYFFKRDADAYVVQTEDVNVRLKALLNKSSIYTVSNTISNFYINPIIKNNCLPSKVSGEFRFLLLSAWYPHKNFEILKHIVRLLPYSYKSRVRFILTLPEEIFQQKFDKTFSDNIINVGPVNVEDGASLYTECDAIFLPTLLECFSATYAEAMVMEKPIITSDMGFAHTVCGDAALYFNPESPEEASQTICMLLDSTSLQKDLINKGKERLKIFGTAKERAEIYLNILDSIKRK